MSGLEKIESMHEVDPMPIVDPEHPDTAIDVEQGGANKLHGLGLSNHSLIWYLTRAQRYSTYVFSTFTLFHITNTSLVPLLTRSVPASEPYLLLTRPYYQSPGIETLMLTLPICTHVASGLALRVVRRSRDAKRFGKAASCQDRQRYNTDLWPAVSGISKLGFLFTPLLVGHVAINRIVPGRGNASLAYVGHAFSRLPAISFVGFSALLVTGVWHMTWGWSKWLGLTPDQITTMDATRQLQKKRRWYLINGTAALVTGMWMAGSFGVIGRSGEVAGWMGREFDDLYRRIPFVSRLL